MLTEDIRRLCGEILAMRHMRGMLMSELRRESSARKQMVTDLCARFGSDRLAMATRTKNERVAYLHGLERSIGSLRREMRKDLAGARRVWVGKAA